MDALLAGPANGSSAGVMDCTLVQADPNLSSPPKRSGERGPRWTLQHKVWDSADAVRDDTAFIDTPPNTFSPAWKTTGGAPCCQKAEGPGRVVCAR